MKVAEVKKKEMMLAFRAMIKVAENIKQYIKSGCTHSDHVRFLGHVDGPGF